jgi:uncharacterized protein YecE (DUF72 family)
MLVGTCGYSYSEWREAGFYPAGLKAASMLPLYAARFPITELNHTWYQMPKAEAVERQRRQAPAQFRFTVKLCRSLTHDVEKNAWEAEVERYRNGVAPLVQAGQLVAVLAQFPPGFDRSPHHRAYLGALLDSLQGLPVAVEFRNDTWAKARVFSELEKRGVTLVAVDEPALPGLFPALDVVTNPALFYVRFHGRNERGWRSGSMAQQFDYDYSDDELNEWIEEKLRRMADRAARGVIFFNNHVAGQAPKNARRLAEMLEASGLAGA